MQQPALSAALRRTVAWLAVLAGLVLAGCAALPAQAPRAASHAFTDVAASPLALLAAASTPDDKRHLSGFALLPGGEQAFDARIALARKARLSLDVQYYLIARDRAGLAFLGALADAAARGVRVRLLIDDLYAAGQDELLGGLAARANVEVRVFNPLPARAGSFGTRVLFSLHDFARINRRMHNKLFIADNSYALTGGRNIGDEYFMRGASANFIDMDVLASGPVVRELSAVFDDYWNSEQAFAIDALAPRNAGAEALRRQFDSLIEGARSAEPLPRNPFEDRLASGRIEMSFAPAHVFADKPGKASPSATTHTAMASALAAMRSAQSEVLIASPYFVPGERGMALLREAAGNNLRISVMTNSLGATDEPLAYWGYARYRHALLKMGVTLYEVSPILSRKSPLFGANSSSLGRLHAKLAVIDRRWLLVGSMNMDARSSRTNTEIALLIDSSALAGEVATLLHHDGAASNYRLRMTEATQRIEWIEGEDDTEIVHRAEPHAGLLMRMRLGLISLFVAEDLL